MRPQGAPHLRPRPDYRHHKLCTVLVVLIIALAGCGQKGPLMMPGEVEPPGDQTTQTTAPGQQDDEDDSEDE